MSAVQRLWRKGIPRVPCRKHIRHTGRIAPPQRHSRNIPGKAGAGIHLLYGIQRGKGKVIGLRAGSTVAVVEHGVTHAPFIHEVRPCGHRRQRACVGGIDTAEIHPQFLQQLLGV